MFFELAPPVVVEPVAVLDLPVGVASSLDDKDEESDDKLLDCVIPFDTAPSAPVFRLFKLFIPNCVVPPSFFTIFCFEDSNRL